MNRNQKLAVGCSGAGCLALIVVLVAGVIAYLNYEPRRYTGTHNYNSNRNSNYNSNSNSGSPGSPSSSTMS